MPFKGYYNWYDQVRGRRHRAAILALVPLTFMVPAVASAQALEPSGTVERVWVAAGQNYGFRVFISNASGNPLSGCVMGFAYVNVSHTNYQAIVATILSNYAQHRPVKLHAFKEDSGFCRIDEIES
jgi:hypothetical protein